MLKRLMAVAVVIALLVGAAAAQRGRRGYAQRSYSYSTLEDFDGTFQFSRIVFRRAPNGDGGDWSVDFPRADENLSNPALGLTRTPVGMDAESTAFEREGDSRAYFLEFSVPGYAVGVNVLLYALTH